MLWCRRCWRAASRLYSFRRRKVHRNVAFTGSKSVVVSFPLNGANRSQICRSVPAYFTRGSHVLLDRHPGSRCSLYIQDFRYARELVPEPIRHSCLTRSPDNKQ